MSELFDVLDQKIINIVNLDDRKKAAILGTLISGIISHMFHMNNMLVCNDSLMHYFDSDPLSKNKIWGGADTTRWLTGCADLLGYWFKSPVIVGVLILVCIAIIAVLLIDIYEINTRTASFAIGALLASFPATISYMLLYSVAYILSLVFIVLAVYWANKKKHWWFGAVFLGIGLSILSTNLMSFAIVALLCMVSILLTTEGISYSSFWKYVVRYAVICIGALAFVLLGTKIVLTLLHTGMSSYQGANQIASIASDNSAETVDYFRYVRNIIESIKVSFKWAYSLMLQIPELKFTLVGCYLMMIICGLVTLIKNKVYKSPIKVFGLIVCIGIISIALSAMNLISPEFRYSGQHIFHWGFFYCGVWMLGEKAYICLYKCNEKLAKTGWYSINIIMAIMIYGFILYDNTAYSNYRLVMDRDQSLVTRVLSRLDSIDEFDYATNPVYVANMPYNSDYDDSSSPLAWSAKLYRLAGPDVNTTLWCYSDISFKAHAWKYEGIRLLDTSDEVLGQIRQEYNTWYFDDYIDLIDDDFEVFRYKDTDTYVVVLRTKYYIYFDE